MQSKFLFIVVLIPGFCFSANQDDLRQISPPALAASAFTTKTFSRNEGTPSPRNPLATLTNTTPQSTRPLTPATQALESLEESDEPEETDEGKKPGKKYTQPIATEPKTLSNGSLKLSAQGKPAQGPIEEVDEENEA